MVASLADQESGCFLVTTVSGATYQLDLDRRQLRRSVGPVLPSQLRLRRDGEDVDLIEIVLCEVGRPMVLLISLNLPGIWLTTRESSNVVRIDELPADNELPIRSAP